MNLPMQTRARAFAPRLAPRLTVLAAGLLALGLASCKAPPKEETFPSLQQVESDVTPVTPPAAPELASQSRVLATVERYDLPLYAPTDEAWQVVDQGVLPRLTRGVWRTNGIRVGLLDIGDLRAFFEALPPPVVTQRTQITATEHPVVLRRSPYLRGTAMIDLTVPPRTVEEVPVTGGRLQLLAQMRSEPFGVVSLNLLPHHYLPEVSLLPRGPLAKQLDGRIFEEIGVRLNVASNRLLVIGLHLPEEDAPAPPASPAPDDASTVNAQPDDAPPEPAEKPLRIEDAPDGLPPHLGHALFTASRAGRPVQVLLLIRVQSLR